MKITPIQSRELMRVETVIKQSFLQTQDSSLEDWLSFDYMGKMIDENRAICLIAQVDDQDVGAIYAQQENPVNGPEGEEKWVIIVMGTIPEFVNQGIGTSLLKELENQLRQQGLKKLFVFTNKDDAKVISYYKNRDYGDAGWIKDYQYGEGNSAVFLLKNLA